jgi:hypothetical protein
MFAALGARPIERASRLVKVEWRTGATPSQCSRRAQRGPAPSRQTAHGVSAPRGARHTGSRWLVLVVDVEDGRYARQLLSYFGMFVGHHGGSESEELDYVAAPPVVALVQLDLDDS